MDATKASAKLKLSDEIKIQKEKTLTKNIQLCNSIIENISKHVDFLFKNKYIKQNSYIDKMNSLVEIEKKITHLENYLTKKRTTKTIIDNATKEVFESIKKLILKTGSNTCKNTLQALRVELPQEPELFNVYNNYFIPFNASISLLADVSDDANDANDDETCHVTLTIKKNTDTPLSSTPLYDTLYGLSLQINDIPHEEGRKIIQINGHLQNDQMHIAKKNFPERTANLQEAFDKINAPVEMKQRFLDQLSLRDFLLFPPSDISASFQQKYTDSTVFKNKPLSVIIKEFIKAPVEKQRDILLVFLLGDQEANFTANILFDLLQDKTFISETNTASQLYNSFHWKLQKILKETNTQMQNEKKKLSESINTTVPYETRILLLPINDESKAKAMEKCKEVQGAKENSSKAQQWLDGLLRIPFGIHKKEKILTQRAKDATSISQKRDYLIQVDGILAKCTYGQTDAKQQIKRIIGQWMNGSQKGQCFGLKGPPGVGKTTVCKNGFAQCLFDDDGTTRPFAFLPLGGASHGSVLEGHNYTYLGSTWGKIVDILIETKCMNPIIYIDELDKISKTEHGREIISILTHLTDSSQNKEFYDKYFSGIPIDVSEVLFIFSYNDSESIDPILRDRIQEIEISPLTLQEKIIISHKYTIPRLLQEVGFDNTDIHFSHQLLTKLITEYTYEAGVRKINEILFDIIRDINLMNIETPTTHATHDPHDPLHLTEEHPVIQRYLLTKIASTSKFLQTTPKIGISNGLYATSLDIGGVLPIQVFRVYSQKKYSLEKMTGNLGAVMKESVEYAMTVAWSILPHHIKTNLQTSDEGYGLHIHCPTGGMPKDGPSASLALTLSILSRLTGVPIRHDVALTGEIDLQGNALQIGGVYSKLLGAYQSQGIRKVLLPRENEKDVAFIFHKEEIERTEYKKHYPELTPKIDPEIHPSQNGDNTFVFKNKIDIIFVDTIFDVLNYGLVENTLEFIRDF